MPDKMYRSIASRLIIWLEDEFRSWLGIEIFGLLWFFKATIYLILAVVLLLTVLDELYYKNALVNDLFH